MEPKMVVFHRGIGKFNDHHFEDHASIKSLPSGKLTVCELENHHILLYFYGHFP